MSQPAREPDIGMLGSVNGRNGRFATLRFDAADELHAWSEAQHGPFARVVHDRGPVGFEARCATGAAVVLADARIAVRQTLRAEPATDCLHLCIDHPAEYGFGRERLHVPASGLAFLPQGNAHTRTSPPGRMVALALPPGKVRAEAAARRGIAVDELVVHGHVASGAALQRDAVVQAVEALSALLRDAGATARALQFAEAMVVSALVDWLDGGARLVRSASIDARRIADLEAWIDAHLGEPITMGSLCAQAGVGARSLQLSFQARRGLRPMRVVQLRRLAALQARLSRPHPEDTVASAAGAVGFGQLGRLAGEYRAVYGELPSATLARARAA